MDLLFDAEIRNWVFIPIIVAMFLFSLIRMNIQKIMGGGPGAMMKKKIKNGD